MKESPPTKFKSTQKHQAGASKPFSLNPTGTLSRRHFAQFVSAIDSNESIRRWVLKFGPIIAKNLRAIRPKPHSRWHLDEMMISIAGRQMYMWRAVDSEGEVLEILVQPQHDKAAALRLLRKLLRRQGFVPKVIVTDKLRSYGAALREIGFSGLHEQGLRANNRAVSRLDDANERCKVQINQVGSAFCFRPCGRLQHIQCTTTFNQ